MQSTLLHTDGKRTFAIVFEEGEEALSGIEHFAEEHHLTAAHLTAIGAFSRATLGYYNRQEKDYDRIPVEEQVEVLAILGNIARHKDKPKVHLHMVLGKSDGTTVGGQLMEGYVRPTLEVIVTEEPGHLRRTMDEATGLPLLNLNEPGSP